MANGQVQTYTWQYYFQALPIEKCCLESKEYQLMGSGWESDFIVHPWLQEDIPGPLKNSQIIIGCNLSSEIFSKVFILNNPMGVAGVLAPNGSALDNAIILNIAALRALADEKLISNYFYDDLPAESITSVLLRLKEGVLAQKYIGELDTDNVRVISVSAVQEKLRGQISFFQDIVLLYCVSFPISIAAPLAAQGNWMLTYYRYEQI